MGKNRISAIKTETSYNRKLTNAHDIIAARKAGNLISAGQNQFWGISVFLKACKYLAYA
jgi:hypothetical protein